MDYSKPLNKYIDYIDDPNDTFEQYVEKGRIHDFRCVFADLDQFERGRELLADSDVILAGAIDFPAGDLSLKEELAEFSAHAKMGFTEIDYVLNQVAVEARDFDAIELEMRSVAEFCRASGIVDKAIVEMCKLDGDDDAKRRICEIARNVRPAFLKTSTGRSFGGAKLGDVRLMKAVLGDTVQIKAAGGIRSFEDARAFIEAGASALGATAGIRIVEEARAAGAL